MSFSKYLTGLAILIVLTACGGGGGSASITGAMPAASAPAVTAIPATVEVLTSANILPSKSGASVEITAFVKNSANVALSGETITFSASSGTLQSSSVFTDASGAVTAKLTAGSDKSSRDIKVTVTAGSVSGNVIGPVTGTRISIAGSGSLQAGGSTTQYAVRAVDSSGTPIGGSKITVISTLGNGLNISSLTTDSTGNATFLYTPNIAGSDALTISGLGTTENITVAVNAIDFLILSPASNTSIPIGTSQSIRVNYRLSGAAVAGKAVVFSTTRGIFALSTSTTDANGEASVNLSSSTAGPAVVVAQISGVGSVNLPVQFVATTPANIVIQANPGSVLQNTAGTTDNQSTVEAIVRDANGNLVANRQVNFTALQDLSNGSISPGIAITDINGRAQVQFIPGASSTANNGVVIQAEVGSTSINAQTSLTVNVKSLFITLAF